MEYIQEIHSCFIGAIEGLGLAELKFGGFDSGG